MKLTIEYDGRWFDRDEWALVMKDKWVIYITFTPINHIWFHLYGWVQVSFAKW